MPRKKFGTAGVALSSWKSSLTVGARGCFHSQAFPMLLLIWISLARHLANKSVQRDDAMSHWDGNCYPARRVIAIEITSRHPLSLGKAI